MNCPVHICSVVWQVGERVWLVRQLSSNLIAVERNRIQVELIEHSLKACAKCDVFGVLAHALWVIQIIWKGRPPYLTLVTTTLYVCKVTWAAL